MKRTGFILFLLVSFTIKMNAQVYNMCTNTFASDTSGTIFDSGGPTGNYGSNENCGFLINPGCADSITINFVSMDIESCCDDINIYDGVDNTGTLLLNAQGTILPGSVTGSSGTIYIEFLSDGSVTPAGFEVNWTTVVGSQLPITANFNTSNAAPAYQEIVTFTDISSPVPSTWFWDFGDGTTSTDQNPSHSYTVVGPKTVQLISANCIFSDTFSQVITVQDPPLLFSQDTITLNIPCGDSVTSSITFYNDSIVPLGYSIQAAGGDLILDSVLSRVNRLNTDITSLVPSLHLFTDGVTGDNISDGGNDMYDTGNMLNTDISGTNNIQYSDNLIIPSTDFGTTGQYFTRKAPGLFVLAADIDNISSFDITGNLGADGSGFSDGVVLTTSVNGSDFTGFVNRTHGAGDASINRLIILKDNPAAAHTFLSTTGFEDHEVTGLNTSTRMYYLMFAAQNGLFVTDAQVHTIMDEFITLLEATPDYLTISPLTDTIAGSDSTVVNFTFNPSGLNAGTYNATITVNNTTPPFANYYVYTVINIFGVAEVTLSDTCIDFGSIVQTVSTRDTIEITNTGCDTLNITSATMTNPDFSIISGPTSLLPGAIGMAIIEFTPSSVGAISGNLLVTTNVEDTTICLSGVGQHPPVVTVTPNPMIVNLACGDSVIQDFYIHNSGLGTLDVTGGIIGGGGVADSSTIFYTTTGATTTHTFNISNTGIDTLFFWVNGNGDYDSGVGINEFISDISVDGVSIGTAATQQLTLGTWDSTLLYITDPLLSTVLADGMITVVVQDGSGVNPGQGALDAHHVRVFTNGEGWLTGSVPVVSILPGDSTAVPVTFHSFGLFQGTYNSTIIIESNDPGSPFDLPVILNISGTAKIALSDSCIDFGNSVVSETLVDTLEITNTGCDTILISSVTSSNPAYTTSVSSTSILPGATSLVIINFTPITLGPISGNILIQSNLADTTICLDGVGLNIITDFVYGDQDPCTAEIVFKDTSRGSPISWFWDFGDGTTDTVFSPTHYFSVPNTYNVTLVTCNATGCDTITKQVIVGFALNEEIVSIGSFEVLTNVDFSVIGLDIILIQWNFGDDSPDDVGLTASHTYALPGEYIVTATVSNSSGCQFDIYDTITITAIGASIAEDLNDLISVYPNPVKDNINISSTIEMLNSRIELVNMLGETVYVGTANLGNNIFDISIDNFENGNYFLKITTDKGDYMSKKILLVK